MLADQLISIVSRFVILKLAVLGLIDRCNGEGNRGVIKCVCNTGISWGNEA